ncbi:MAG: hypothetical protein K2X12_14250, partial [Burkholderiaceae bacterium]|nr:hypothetical protein [Burkholderiaceae bacterium]
QALGFLGAHGGLHVVGDAFFEAHGGRVLEESAEKKQKPAWASPRGLVGKSARRVRRIVTAEATDIDQYSFLGSCMLRTRL